MSWRETAIVKPLTTTKDGKKLTASEKLTLLVLSDYMEPGSRAAWPSIPKLAEECLLSPRQMTRLLAQLKVKGMISIERRKMASNIYRFTAWVYGAMGDKMSPPDNPTVTEGHGVGDILPGFDPDIAMSPEPEVEPSSIEPEVSPPSEEVAKDPRYKPFLDAFCNFYLWLAKEKHGWAACHGKQLKLFLQEHREIDVHKFKRWLLNYARSEKINPAAKARQVLPTLYLYMDGPLDEFKKPKIQRLQIVTAGADSAIDRHRRAIEEDKQRSLARFGCNPAAES